MLPVALLAAEPGRDEVRPVRESNVLHGQSKGKTREGAEDKMISRNVLTNRERWIAFPNLQCFQSSVPLCSLNPDELLMSVMVQPVNHHRVPTADYASVHLKRSTWGLLLGLTNMKTGNVKGDHVLCQC